MPVRARNLILPAIVLLGSIQVAVAGVGTPIEARLLTPVSSYSSKTGAGIQALVATPLCSAGDRLPDGAIVLGSIRRVHKVGLGLRHETARMELAFRELQMPDGRTYPIEARLTGVDSARERVDSRGVVRGIRATGAISTRFSSRLAFGVPDHPYFLIPAFVAEAALLRFPEPEIEYPRGTELYLEAQLGALPGSVSRCALDEPASAPEASAELHSLVDGLPVWSYSKRQRQPMDLVTLAFVGSPEEVERAFTAAGWSGARSNSLAAGLHAIRAIAEGSAYADAPMRTLLLDGAEADFALQKALNTFEKRHHLRLWKRPDTWEGRPVWASAATQDVSATFSMRPFGFTHQIENDVDRERDKVVNDLVFTGCVDSVTYVPRMEPVRAPGREYRRGVNSDSRVAVVVLNACQSPRPELAVAEEDPQPPWLVRAIRRITLTGRNHLIRDNLVWRSADAARLGFLAFRNWKRQRKDELRARTSGAVATAALPPSRPPDFASGRQ